MDQLNEENDPRDYEPDARKEAAEESTRQQLARAYHEAKEDHE